MMSRSRHTRDTPCHSIDHSYLRAGWRWSNDDKRREMLEPGTRYIIVDKPNPRSPSQRLPVAFLSFQFTREDVGTDENAPADMTTLDVLYCYEVHVEPDERGRGLGRFLMGCAEKVAEAHKMRACMLTVLCESMQKYCCMRPVHL